jgi:hypothetical protein
MGRHADALKIYPTAIDSQRKCCDRVPESEMMRELLSKMYYNFGQSLRATGKFDEAMQAAQARRQLWKASGERLVGVAAEMADLNEAVLGQPDAANAKTLAKALDQDILATLNQAYETGWPRTIDLAEPRFAGLKKNEHFAAKIAELNERASRSKSN